jgi:hypothetical protein
MILFLWGLSFIYAAGPRQRSLSRVRVPWDSWPYFTVSDLRLPFSSLPTTRRVTVEVYEPVSTRVTLENCYCELFINSSFAMRENALIVASLLTRSLDPSPLFRYPSVYSCATRRLGSARLGSLGTEKTPLRLPLSNRGSVFRCYSSCIAWIRHNIVCPTDNLSNISF